MTTEFSVYLLLLEAVCLHLPVQGYIPEGYLGCFKDYALPNRVLHEKSAATATNSGDRCKTVCKSANYRYAGTEFRRQCFCGNQIRTQVLSDGCNLTCAGNKEENCGGVWHISIYDTWMCATKPCEHGGECEDINAHNFSCTCTGQWTGKACELELAVDGNKSLLAVYIMLPVFAIFLVLIFIGIYLKQRKRKDNGDTENILQGTELMPHLYENVAEADHESTGNINLDGVPKNRSQDLENEPIRSVTDTYNEIYSDNVMINSSEYNVLSLPKAKETGPGLVYDHIDMQTNSTLDSCYSNVSKTKKNIAKAVPLNTYSHIRDITANTVTADTTYNKLENYAFSKDKNSRMQNGILADKVYDQLCQTQNSKAIDNSEYNVQSLSKVKVTGPGLVYDHIDTQSNSTLDSCYSSVSKTKINVAKAVPLKTYSHIRDITANTVTADTTYNKLENHVLSKGKNSRMQNGILADKVYDQLCQTQNSKAPLNFNSPIKNKLTAYKQLNREEHSFDEENEYSIID